MRSGRSRSVYFLLLGIISLFLISGCATTGPGGKKSLILVSTAQEVSIGQSLDEELRQTEKTLADTAWQNYISAMGNKIVSVSDRSDLEFHFTVIESDQVNAFATPGGYVYFYTGLLHELDNESELAAVMAHEISHVVGRHGVKRLQTIMGASVLLDLALGEKSETTKSLATAATGILMQGYSRDQEREADEFGIIYASRAGWHPNGFVGMFEKLKVLSGGEGDMSFFEMLSASHPPLNERIDNVQSQIKGMKPLPNNLVSDSRQFQSLKKRLPAKTDSGG